jgi:succinate dehydrogenase hydrophobic membrane anchor protein
LDIPKNVERSILDFLDRMPLISFYAKTRGWPYVIAWFHRIAGLMLVVYLWFHTYTLLSLSNPPLYDASMKIYGSFPFTILEWALAIPVIFHALNGGRLILYEGFEMRNDGSMMRYVSGLSVVYVSLFGVLMIMGTQSVSPVFYWLTMLIAALTLAYGVASKFWKTQHSLLWKLQRISGAFLLVMVPAHLLFMHLNPSMGKDANTVITRMQNSFIKFTDMGLIVMVIYHAGYGLMSVIRDYVSFRVFRAGLAVLVIFIMVISAWAGIKLTISI